MITSLRPQALARQIATRQLRESRHELRRTMARMDALTSGMEARAARFSRTPEDITAPMSRIRVDALHTECL